MAALAPTQYTMALQPWQTHTNAKETIVTEKRTKMNRCSRYSTGPQTPAISTNTSPCFLLRRASTGPLPCPGLVEDVELTPVGSVDESLSRVRKPADAVEGYLSVVDGDLNVSEFLQVANLSPRLEEVVVA